MPFFSIVIPVYNVEKYLPRCLASVDAQTFVDYEVVLVNDGSTDSSGEICASYKEASDKTVRIITQENSGLLQARRSGFVAARGSVIVSMDSDDALRPDALQIIHDAMRGNDADICCYELSDTPDFSKFRRPPQFEKETVFSGPEMHSFIEAFCRSAKLNAVVAKAAKAEVLGVNDDYSFYGHLNFGEDHLQTLAMLDRAHTCVYLPIPLYYYRPNPASITKKFSYKEWDEIVAVRTASKLYGQKWAQKYGDESLLWYTDMHTLREICAFCQRVVESGSLSERRECFDAVLKSECFREAYRDQNGRKLLRFDMRLLLMLLTHRHYALFGLLSRGKTRLKQARK